MGAPERFKLRWDGFEANTRVALMELRDEVEFFDVTLVSGDGKQVKASKVVLACGSSFFHKILRENPHPHPLIYLKEVQYKHLMFLLDFLYTGETSIAEGDLNQFLNIAEDLKIKGLTLTDKQTKSAPKDDAPLQSQVSPEENAPAKNKPTPSVIPDPQGQMAAEENAPAKSKTTPSVIPSPQGQMAAEENAPAKRKTFPPSAIHVPPAPQGEVAAEDQSPAESISSPPSFKPAFYQGLVSADERTSLPRESRFRSMTPPLAHSSNAFPKSNAEDDTCNVKVEVGNAECYKVSYGMNDKGEQYIISYGMNDQGEQYIISVSKRDLHCNEKNHRYLRKRNVENQNEDMEQEQNDQSISARKKPKEELIDLNSDTLHENAVDSVVGNEEVIHASYERFRENESMIPAGGQDNYIEPNKKKNCDKDEIVDSKCDIVITEAATSDWYEQVEDIEGNNEIQELEQNLNDEEFSSGERYSQCSICSKVFASASALKVHMKSHAGEKPYQCSVCSKSFAWGSDLSRHMRIHTGEKPYHCKHCTKSFSWLTTLNNHEMIHTDEKSYHCKHCTKSFSQLSTLKNHERIHTGEKPYHCKHCTKSFSRLTTLKNHEMIHTGEKPYHCKQCSKSFSRLRSLNEHERIHAGEKPYRCQHWTKSFNWSKVSLDWIT